MHNDNLLIIIILSKHKWLISSEDAGSLSLSQGCHDPTSAALLIAKGTTRPLDVMRVSQGSSNILYDAEILIIIINDVVICYFY